jgi:TonB family protein
MAARSVPCGKYCRSSRFVFSFEPRCQGLCGSETASKTTQSSAADSYPNTADGLHSLLTDLLAAAKSDDQGKLWSKIAEMEIPNYENWFTHTYGPPEKGRALATAYGQSLKPSEQQFEMLWTELAKQEGEIVIGKLDVNRKFNLAKKDDSLANPTDRFKAEWNKTDASAGPAAQPIGYFCFVDGKFRLTDFPHEVHILPPFKPGPLVSGKLVSRVQPIYPETARQLRLRGMVSVNVVIHKDGTVTVQNVGAGHPLLAPAAVEAVQQWKYQPTTVSGEPVDVQAKIYVTFDSGQQQGEAKQ